MASALLVATPIIIPLLFGSGFAAAVRPGFVLICAGMFSGINLVLADGFRGMGKPEIPLYAEISGLCITAVGLALFLKPYGIMGAAAISLVSYSTSTFVHGAYYCRMFPFKTSQLWSDYHREWDLIRGEWNSRKSTIASSLAAEVV
jgi:O-antigen/teichoic acid export membrane protein